MASSRDKDVYDIKKYDGSNFTLWKEQIQYVLVQKKQRLCILRATRTEQMNLTHFEWAELDALCKSTLRLHLAKSVYFTILECATLHAMWLKLCNTYEKNTTNNKVFLMCKLYNLCMKESTNVASHINEFYSLFA